jgi:Protein of unknown function (DUF3822)
MNQDIISKTYRKLNLIVSQSGFSYCEIDTLNSKILTFEKSVFDNSNNVKTIDDLYCKIFIENEIFSQKFDQITVVHDNNLCCFVPTPFFDENLLGSYLQYNVKVFETDFFAFDTNQNSQFNTVYVPYVNINNVLIDQFGSFDYKHSSSVLVSKLLEISKNIDDKKMFVHMQSNHFDIVVVQNQKLLLYNSFEYKTPEDVIYYILFTAEQLLINPENFLLEFLGNIDAESPIYKIVYKYIRNVSLMDVSDLQAKNQYSEAENRQHFILFNA